MKKFFLLSLLVGLMPLCSIAQDDMYFSSKKDKAARRTEVKQTDIPAYYSGSKRDIDEYNRRGLNSYYQNIGDSASSDVIDFYGNTPDSIYGAKSKKNIGSFSDYDDDDDYSYYRRMRWLDDDFFWAYDPWYWDDPWYRSYYGYYGPYYGYGWGRPWRYGYYGYYGGWYDPWYQYSGWYDPWYYGWNRPYWGTTVVYRPYNRGGVTGTANHGWISNGRHGGLDTSRRDGTNLAGYRGSSYNGSNSTSRRNTDAYNRQTTRRGTDFSNYRGNENFNRADRTNNFNQNRDFNQNREFNQSYRNESTFNRGSFNSGSSFGGGSFGGGNRGGGFSGGGRSGGGGHLGGRR